MITYLQSTDLIVGVDSMERGPFNITALGKGLPSGRDNPYSIAHPELGDKPFIGTNQIDNPELILTQNPDVILATWRTGKDADALSEKTGTPVVALVSGDLGKNKPQFYQSFRIMGKILGKEERAESVIGYIEQTLQDLNRRTKDIPAEQRKKVYVAGISYFGAHGLLSTVPTYPALLMVNGYNVATGAESGGQNLMSGQNIMIDKEKLLEWNPEIILVDEASYSMVKEDLKDPVYQSLSAVKNNRIYGVMPYNWYANNYDTVLADAYYIGKTLYPEQFADVDPAQKADEIYTMLDGKPVYPQMKQMFGGFVPFFAITK
ncbi:MAG: iron ABC transporter substrate-binding protein [Methanoregula sp.]|nr:iron ABC transporter substrate-binding protein [Methanoregula sp.]